VRTVVCLFGLLFLTSCSSPPEIAQVKASEETRKDDQYRKELEEIRKNIRSEIKIKLKRDGKGDFYSWEISGKDTSEVLRANEILSKKLDPK
jgi:hypothetical protein